MVVTAASLRISHTLIAASCSTENPASSLTLGDVGRGGRGHGARRISATGIVSGARVAGAGEAQAVNSIGPASNHVGGDRRRAGRGSGDVMSGLPGLDGDDKFACLGGLSRSGRVGDELALRLG